MNITEILIELRNERDRLDRAIAALDGVAPQRGRRRAVSSAVPRAKRRGGRRHMSAEARKQLSAMMRKRWVERKKQGKTRL